MSSPSMVIWWIDHFLDAKQKHPALKRQGALLHEYWIICFEFLLLLSMAAMSHQ
jgi:hypothetical protein